MIQSRLFWFMGALIFTLCFVVASLWCWHKFTTPQNISIIKTEESSSLSAHPEIVMNNLSLHQVGKKEKNGWILNSSKSSFIKPLNIVECETVTCTIVTQQAEVATLKASKSFIDRGKQTMFLAGPVEGSFKGMRVTGNDIHYTFSSHQLETTKNSSLYHPHFNITATQSFIDLKTKKMILEEGVVSEFIQSSNSPGTNNSNH